MRLLPAPGAPLLKAPFRTQAGRQMFLIHDAEHALGPAIVFAADPRASARARQHRPPTPPRSVPADGLTEGVKLKCQPLGWLLESEMPLRRSGAPRTLLDFLSELVRADDGEQRIASCDFTEEDIGHLYEARHWI